MTTCIRTASGRMLDLADPSPDDILLSDIAKALSRLERFTGHCPLRPTVAQHSLAVEHIANCLLPDDYDAQDYTALARAALMHDAQEAYCSDLSAPAKRTMRSKRNRSGACWISRSSFDDLEDRLSDAIQDKFHCAPGEWGSVIHQADQLAWAYESAWFDWSPHELPDWLKRDLYVKRCYRTLPDTAQAAFLRRAAGLGLRDV